VLGATSGIFDRIDHIDQPYSLERLRHSLA
jgi:hypothetical protein